MPRMSLRDLINRAWTDTSHPAVLFQQAHQLADHLDGLILHDPNPSTWHYLDLDHAARRAHDRADRRCSAYLRQMTP